MRFSRPAECTRTLVSVRGPPIAIVAIVHFHCHHTLWIREEKLWDFVFISCGLHKYLLSTIKEWIKRKDTQHSKYRMILQKYDRQCLEVRLICREPRAIKHGSAVMQWLGVAVTNEWTKVLVALTIALSFLAAARERPISCDHRSRSPWHRMVFPLTPPLTSLYPKAALPQPFLVSLLVSFLLWVCLQ